MILLFSYQHFMKTKLNSIKLDVIELFDYKMVTIKNESN